MRLLACNLPFGNMCFIHTALKTIKLTICVREVLADSPAVWLRNPLNTRGSVSRWELSDGVTVGVA